LCDKEQVARVKEAILKLNKKAKIIETVKSVVDLKEVLNTGKFNYEEMIIDHMGLTINKEEEEERGPEDVVTSFVYQRNRPFHTNKLYEILNQTFMLEIVLPDEDEDGEDEHDEDDD
jgi:G3E family GTPase